MLVFNKHTFIFPSRLSKSRLELVRKSALLDKTIPVRQDLCCCDTMLSNP